MKRLLAFLAASMFATSALAANNSISGSFYYNVPSSVLTRPANTTSYTANTAICANTSGTVCAPLTVSVGNHASGTLNGEVQTIRLLKSGSTTTNATFNIWLYSSAPTVTAIYDNVAYVGPFKADLPNYIGSATCSTPTLTTDGTESVWYDCTLNNPNTAGAFTFQTLPGTTGLIADQIDAIIEVTGPYTPSSQETFQVFISGFY